MEEYNIDMKTLRKIIDFLEYTTANPWLKPTFLNIPDKNKK